MTPECRAELIALTRARIAQLEAEIQVIHLPADRQRLIDTRDDMVVELRRLYEPTWRDAAETTDPGDADRTGAGR